MSAITVTENAAVHLQALVAKNENAVGIRLGTSTKGCNGLSYTIDYTDAPAADDELVEAGGVKIYIARKEMLYLMGTEIDWEDTMFSRGFSFKNPNESGRCGCGESFTV